MEMKLYELYFELWHYDKCMAYLLDVEKDTDRTYSGTAIRLDGKTGEIVPNGDRSRFRLSKDDVNQVGGRSGFRPSVCVVHVFGNDFYEAKSKAVQILSRKLDKWLESLECGVSLEDRLADADARSVEAKVGDKRKDDLGLG